MNKKLYRDEYHKVLGGVCSGLAEYFDMDVTMIRLLFAFSVIIAGVGVIPYIVLWMVLPKKDYTYNHFNNPTVDYTVPASATRRTVYAPPRRRPTLSAVIRQAAIRAGLTRLRICRQKSGQTPGSLSGWC